VKTQKQKIRENTTVKNCQTGNFQFNTEKA